MAGRRIALLVATSLYGDPGLRGLRAPAGEAEELKEVLRSQGDFTAEVLRNESKSQIERGIEDLFQRAGPDDLVLLYLSCHGIKNDGGQLLFAACNTEGSDRVLRGQFGFRPAPAARVPGGHESRPAGLLLQRRLLARFDAEVGRWADRSAPAGRAGNIRHHRDQRVGVRLRRRAADRHRSGAVGNVESPQRAPQRSGRRRGRRTSASPGWASAPL
ncbi:caspase family protein [Saccharopolyspora phatthalungensis]|uniref:Peptidase C14 caspase domain-containing protein n=1 Tax=Saccharopolyspora phatthalungensis TaxID=664693 RepID=A0A840Q605_9PSEU|nr:caspase family protein [Saccharopolyspora phatthalungensis]MBB5155387.1 hypothetical protein [Saccharopolyspora phatthalungensis]